MTQKPTHRCHVISNTHWDREWRYPFQAYRMDLVEMMDSLLDTMERREEYRAFLLDSQTVLIEDYLEIRPENEERIASLVQADRLHVGPWYTLPDMWACPGEALVRNLLLGHRQASKFGPVCKVGYTPFSNGQVSQLPQIHRGFGIEACFFYRGVGKHVCKSDFRWEGADGSEIFGFRFSDYARYNYYYLLYRPGLLGRSLTDREYEWTPEEVPYRVAVEQSQDHQFGWINQRLSVHPEGLAKSVKQALDVTKADATTTQLPYMMGHDHSFAAEAEIDLIEAAAREAEKQGHEIIHGSLAEYLEQFKAEAGDLEVLRGEQRHPNKEGKWTNLFAQILSCRLYLKQRNAQLCAQISHEVEPLVAQSWLTGSEYPWPFLELAWKRLLINQAHDAIGGCSVDRVHEEMLTRWGEVETIGDELSRRAMRDVASRIDGSTIDPSDLQLTVFNTLSQPRSGVAELLIDLPPMMSEGHPAIQTQDGGNVPFQILSEEAYRPTIEGGLELAMPFDVRRLRVAADLPAIPPFGHEALVVTKTGEPEVCYHPVTVGEREIENESLRVVVKDDGTLCMTDKRNGRVFDGLGLFEDVGELGDPWNHIVPDGDTPIFSGEADVTVSALRMGPLLGTLRVETEFVIPVECVDGKRSEEMVALPITLDVSLRRGSTALDLEITLDNRAKDHRLRLRFPTCLVEATHSAAGGQFDVVERPIATPNGEGWVETPSPTHPMWHFVDVSDGPEGFGVIGDGLTEFEVSDDQDRAIIVTLVRCFGKFIYERPTPGSQCQGVQRYRFSLVPHRGKWSEARMIHRAEEHLTRPLAIESAPTRGSEPRCNALLTQSNPQIVVSAVKRHESDQALVVRLWNPLESNEEVTVTTGLPLLGAERLTLEEIGVEALDIDDERSVSLSIGPKKIETLKLDLKRRTN